MNECIIGIKLDALIVINWTNPKQKLIEEHTNRDTNRTIPSENLGTHGFRKHNLEGSSRKTLYNHIVDYIFR